MNFPIGPSGSVDSRSSIFVCSYSEKCRSDFLIRYLFNIITFQSQYLFDRSQFAFSRLETAIPICSMCDGFIIIIINNFNLILCLAHAVYAGKSEWKFYRRFHF